MNFRPRRSEDPELNLIPMIDVLIVLLIFLVLTTTFSRESELKIQLPQATGQPPAEDKTNLEITVDAAGHFLLNSHPLVNDAPATLRKALTEAAGTDRDPVVIINADRQTPHQAVITVLDAASQLGFSRITFGAASMPGESR